MFHDHCIYEFEVEFTQTVNHYNDCQERTGTSLVPRTRGTLRLVADKYEESIAEAWVKERFRHAAEPEKFKIISMTRRDLDGMLLNMNRL